MSLQKARSYFKTHLKALGYTEHLDGFQDENLGEINLNKAFHVRALSISGGSINQLDQRTDTVIVVSTYYKGLRNADEANQTALKEVEKVLKECVNITNRTSDGVLNVVFNRADIRPVSDTNAIHCVIDYEFEVSIMIGVEED